MYLVAHLTTMAVTAKSIIDAISAEIDDSDPKSISLQRNDPAAPFLQKLVQRKLRVIILIMSTPQIREIAVLWKQQAHKDRWVWITDNKILQIDFDSDTSEVRPNSAFCSSSGATVAQYAFEQSASCDVSQAVEARRALHGWLYLMPLDPDTPGVRQFKRQVRELTQSELFESPASKARITLDADEPIDAAAAKLYDGIFLWAKAMSRVFASNGAPLHGLTG